ncbi:hypothetical protein GCM10017782_30210 [Deinococcus ficus]|nr:hypothetical protein GCM10017782_30210 [Deinococcus ficus]
MAGRYSTFEYVVTSCGPPHGQAIQAAYSSAPSAISVASTRGSQGPVAPGPVRAGRSVEGDSGLMVKTAPLQGGPAGTGKARFTESSPRGLTGV